MPEFATLADVKLYLDKTNTKDDAELQQMVDAANEEVADIVGGFESTTVTEYVAPLPDGTVLLRHRPTGPVTLNDGTITGFLVDADAGLLRGVVRAPRNPWAWAPGPLTATYTTGTGQVPASVRLAVCVIAGHLWETQRGGSSPNALALQSGPEEPIPAGLGFAIPNRARELLAPYVRGTQIA